jgi:hypothetical protein
VIGIEARIEAPEIQERVQQKPGADQKWDSEGDLSADQPAERKKPFSPGDGP